MYFRFLLSRSDRYLAVDREYHMTIFKEGERELKEFIIQARARRTLKMKKLVWTASNYLV